MELQCGGVRVVAARAARRSGKFMFGTGSVFRDHNDQAHAPLAVGGWQL
jgi:hypothetical protein